MLTQPKWNVVVLVVVSRLVNGSPISWAGDG